MKKWLEKNSKTLIVTTFLIPIIIVAVVSISHVSKWYEISNPISWAMYLSVGIEIAALSSLAALSTNMGNKVYFPFIIVTLIQFIGNIFFSYSFIDVESLEFKSWVELTIPLMEMFGIEAGDVISHKRVLALFSGGMLPLISLSFLHMLVKVNNERTNHKEEIKTDDTVETETVFNETEAEEPPQPIEEMKVDHIDTLDWIKSKHKSLKKVSEFKTEDIELVEPIKEIGEISNETKVPTEKKN